LLLLAYAILSELLAAMAAVYPLLLLLLPAYAGLQTAAAADCTLPLLLLQARLLHGRTPSRCCSASHMACCSIAQCS
jgi:hypothetical protein